MAPLNPAQLAAHLEERTRGWPPEQRAAMVTALASAKNRRDLVLRAEHPAQLAHLCDPSYVVTPAVELVSRSIERALREPGRNLLVSAPPQELKSMLCSVWTPIRALQLHPNWNIMDLTFTDTLAERNSFDARERIERYGTGAKDSLTGAPLPDMLGLSLRANSTSVSRWRINEGSGGMLATGIRSTVTGMSANLIIVDDPYKGPQETDSPTIREKIMDIYRSVIQTRLAPGGSVILIQTRWHPEDLSGRILAEEAELPPELRTWRYLNIPAVSAPGVPDALNRPEPGIWLESARGRTPEEFQSRRRKIGERFWWAMYMGVPADPEGGLFAREWFESTALTEQPADAVMRIVAVDPAETGDRDEAGIVASALLADGGVVLTHDVSGKLTSDEWAGRAVDLAVEIGASEIWVEAYTAGTTYTNVLRKVIAARLAALVVVPGASAEASMAVFSQRAMLTSLRVNEWRGKGDAVVRSALLRQAVEVGTAQVVRPAMDTMIEQAVNWQAGQHCPDRVAASVIAHDVAAGRIARRGDVGNPLRSQSRAGNQWVNRRVK